MAAVTSCDNALRGLKWPELLFFIIYRCHCFNAVEPSVSGHPWERNLVSEYGRLNAEFLWRNRRAPQLDVPLGEVSV